MPAALRTPASQLSVLAARVTTATPRVTELTALAAYGPPSSQGARASQFSVLVACGPPGSYQARAAQDQTLIAYAAGETNVSAKVSQAQVLIAYGTGVPITQVANTWTFIMDGHRFWVVSLGPEGDWAYDTETKQWCQLNSQGFPGLNFTHGTMWGLRVFGGDALYPFLYELDPNQPDDEGWRAVEHIVTGGIQTRSPTMIGVANFRLTASAGALSDASTDVNLTFSDDNGNTWSDVFTIPVNAGEYDKPLLYPALGSFGAPGRIFRVTDSGGMLSIYGADAALNNFDEDEASGGRGG